MTLHRIFFTCAAASLALGSVSAQVANPTPSTPEPTRRESRRAEVIPEPKTDDAVELSPFVVNANQDVGYLAGNTLAGSRLNTPLKDTASSISILTEEFLKDIGALSLTDALEYANNAQLERDDAGTFGDSPAANTTFFNFDTYRVRGQKATVARNYFPWVLPVDTYNVGRIEEARGPNSVLFGLGSAGGVLSASTKQADTSRSFRSASLVTDQYTTYRGSVDINHVLIKNKLALRVDAVGGRTETFRQHSFNEPKRIFVTGKYNITNTTRLRAEYETGKIDENVQRVGALYDGLVTWLNQGRPTFDTPIATNAAIGITNFGATRRVTYIGNDARIYDMRNTDGTTKTNTQIIDPTLYDPSISTGGPGQIRNVSFNAPSVFLEQQFGSHTFLELAFNHQDFKSHAHMAAGDSTYLFADPNRKLPDGSPNPHVGQFYIEGPEWNWIRDEEVNNYRATLSHDLNLGKWGEYRFAGLAEYEARTQRGRRVIEVWGGMPFSATPEATANQVWRRSYVTPGDWGGYYSHGPAQTGLIQGLRDPVSGLTLSSTFLTADNALTDDPADQKTLMGAAQARYFDGRVVIGAGYRFDKVHTQDRGSVRDPVTQEWLVDYARNDGMYDDEGKTYTAGVVGHVTKQIAVVYNRSMTFGLPQRSQKILPDAGLAPNPESTGDDIGLTFDLLGGKLYARATYYKTETIRGTVGGFGGTNTAPQSISQGVMNALLSAGVVTQAVNDAHITQANNALGDTRMHGYEFSLIGNPTRDWRIQANYSITDGALEKIGAEVEEWWAVEKAYYKSFNQGSLVTGLASRTIDQAIQFFDDNITSKKAAEGVGLVGSRKFKVNVFSRYSFSSGMLKGLYVGGGYRHQSKMLIGKKADKSRVYGNSYWLADALIGYRVPQMPFIKRLNLQLNISNLFDDRTPLITRADDSFVYRFAMQTPRMWRLTADFDF